MVVRRVGEGVAEGLALPPKKDEICEKNEVPDIGGVGRC